MLAAYLESPLLTILSSFHPPLPICIPSSIPPLTLSPSLLPLFPLSPYIHASPITSLYFPYLLLSLSPSSVPQFHISFLFSPPPPTSSISPSLFVCFSPTWSHTINHSLLPPSPSPHLLHLSFSVCMFSPLLGVTTLTIPSSCSCRMSILCCLRATLWVSMVTYWCTQSPQ